MSSPPSHEHSTAVPAAEKAQAPPSPNYALSADTAQGRITQCHQFLSFAQYLRDQWIYLQRSAGERRSEDDKEGFAALRKQWKDLLDGKLLDGVDEVLTDAFQDEAVGQLDRLDWEDDEDEDEEMRRAREGWIRVLRLIGECETAKREGDEVLGEK